MVTEDGRSPWQAPLPFSGDGTVPFSDVLPVDGVVEFVESGDGAFIEPILIALIFRVCVLEVDGLGYLSISLCVSALPTSEGDIEAFPKLFFLEKACCVP